jgi:Fis family transcriptional regulator, factor for inversion stimulation protein
VKALLLDGAPELERACAAAGLEVVRAASLSEARALAAGGGFDLVDARLSRPWPLDEELRQRVEAFFQRLGGEQAEGLYEAVMREVERPLIAGALARAQGVRATAAEVLGIDRGTLVRRMRALGLDVR